MSDLEDDDGFDSLTRSDDAVFHQWAVDNDFDHDIDYYEACEAAWKAAKAHMRSA